MPQAHPLPNTLGETGELAPSAQRPNTDHAIHTGEARLPRAPSVCP